MKDYLLWRKIARIIDLLAIRLEIPREKALSLFYNTNVCTQLHNPEYELQIMSDAYIVDEVMNEMERKQEAKNRLWLTKT